MRTLISTFLVVSLSAFLTSCATTQNFQGHTLESEFTPYVDVRSENADELLERILTGTTKPQALMQEIDTLRAISPQDSRLHAAAAYVAELLGDEAEQWRSLMLASASISQQRSALFIDEMLLLPLTLRERRSMILLLEELLPRVDANNAASIHRTLASQYDSFGESQKADRHRAELGFIDDMLFAGVFDNDQGKGFSTTHPPEKIKSYDDKMKSFLAETQFAPVPLFSRSGVIDFAAITAPARFVAAYVAFDVDSASEQAVHLRASTGDAMRIFHDGRLVYSVEHVDDFAFDNLVIPVVLKKGTNTFLVKSAQRGSSWLLGLRFTDTLGNTLELGAHASKSPKTSEGVLPKLVSPEEPQRPTWGKSWDAFLNTRQNIVHGFALDALTAMRPLLETPLSAMVNFHGSRVYLGNKEEGRALDALNRAVELSGQATGVLTERALYYMSKKQFKKAQSDLSASKEASRRRLLRLAEVYSRRGFTLEREQVLDELLSVEKGLVLAQHRRAQAHAYRGRYAEAETIHEKVLKDMPGNIYSLRTLAEYKERRQKLLQSLDLIRKRQKIWPTHIGDRFYEIRLLLRMNDFAQAINKTKLLIERNPSDANARRLLGDIYFEQGERDAAIAEYERSAERDPDNTRMAERLDELAPKGLGRAQKYVPGDEEIALAIEKAKGLKAPPGAQSVYLLDHEITEVAADGSAKRIVTKVSLAIDVDGRDALTKERIPSGSKTKLLRAYSLTPSGEEQEASSVRNGEIRFRALTPGSITVVQFVHYQRAAGFLPNHFVSSWYFQGVSSAFLDSQWILILPKDKGFVFEKSDGVQMTDTTEGNERIVTFASGDALPFSPEPYSRSARDLLRKVSVSTLTSWDEYVAWEKALLSQVFVEDPEITALAKKLTKGKSGKLEQLKRLYRYVAQEIRYQQDYESTIAGVKPHACRVVLSRGYGDCKDKAVLLILLAKELGIDVDFAILRTRGAGQVEKKIPNQQFNHAIAYIPKQEGIDEGFFMDPTTDALDLDNLRSDDQGVTSLVLDPESGEWRFVEIPFRSSDEEMQRYNISLEVKSPTEAQGTSSLITRGGLASSLRRLLRNPERAQKFHQDVAGRLVNGARVVNASVSDIEDLVNPLRVTHELDATRSLASDVNGGRVALPTGIMFPISRQTIGLEKRRYAMLFGPPQVSTFEFKLALPKGARLSRVPKNIKSEGECFSFELRASEGKAKRIVSLSSRFERTCAEVSPTQYKNYRERVEKILGTLEEAVEFTWGDVKTVSYDEGKPSNASVQ